VHHVQVTPHTSIVGRGARTGRDWPLMPVIRPESMAMRRSLPTSRLPLTNPESFPENRFWKGRRAHGSKAVLNGSIAEIGAQYTLILKVLNCSNGESLTSTKAQANDKTHVLDALGNAASEIRKRLGESLGAVQRYDIPLVQATTSSLEALQAFSLGWKTMKSDNPAAAIPLFQRAIRLDPNFTMAYAVLGQSVFRSHLGMRRR